MWLTTNYILSPSSTFANCDRFRLDSYVEKIASRVFFFNGQDIIYGFENNKNMAFKSQKNFPFSAISLLTRF